MNYDKILEDIIRKIKNAKSPNDMKLKNYYSCMKILKDMDCEYISFDTLIDMGVSMEDTSQFILYSVDLGYLSLIIEFHEDDGNISPISGDIIIEAYNTGVDYITYNNKNYFDWKMRTHLHWKNNLWCGTKRGNK